MSFRLAVRLPTRERYAMTKLIERQMGEESKLVKERGGN